MAGVIINSTQLANACERAESSLRRKLEQVQRLEQVGERNRLEVLLTKVARLGELGGKGEEIVQAREVQIILDPEDLKLLFENGATGQSE